MSSDDMTTTLTADAPLEAADDAMKHTPDADDDRQTASAKGRGKRLTDAQRMQIIALLEDKTAPLSRAECARLYGVSPAAIGKLMKVSASVKKRYADAGADAGHLRDKRQRGGFSKNMCFEDELFQWICSLRARRIPLLVAHVQQKAKILATKHRVNDAFKASNGWYYRFCARYGLVPGSLHSGSSSSDVVTSCSSTSSGTAVTAPAAIDASDSDASRRPVNSAQVARTPDWSDDPVTSERVRVLQDTVERYGPEFVYSLTEARLFYRLLPLPLLAAVASTSNTSHTTASSRARASDSRSESSASAQSKGDSERVMLLVCANGTGTHKIPLLVVSKRHAPCDALSTTSALATAYVSDHDVWCDDATFQFWCARVFAPAIAARTTHAVLLLLDNPAGSLTAFATPTIATHFVPTRPASLSASCQFGTAASAFDAFQPLTHGVTRELKRRYKVALVHDVLSFAERTDEERYRLRQRARKRPLGAAGVAFGHLPHVGDAVALLSDAWHAIPPQLLRLGWQRAHVSPDCRSVRDARSVGVSDDAVVTELVALLERANGGHSVQAKDVRSWLHADDDASERMQQELLLEVQRMLTEEERCVQVALETPSLVPASADAAVPVTPVEESPQPQQLAVYDHQQSPFASSLQQTALSMDPTNSVGFDYAHLHALPLHSASFVRPMAPVPPPPIQQTDALTALREQRKAVSVALRALATAEEALDNADVAAHFGRDVTRDASLQVRALLRRLRRVHRGTQSTLRLEACGHNGAQTNQAIAPVRVHAYVYGDSGACDRETDASDGT